MWVRSRSSSMLCSTKESEASWQLVNTDQGAEMGRKQITPVARLPNAHHRRGHTEGTRRLSIFKVPSRSNTMSNLSTSRPISPSASIDSLNAGHEPESSRPQSVWSDSDNSDSQTKRWVAKGSKMLRKQNSRFNLSSSRMVDWLEEDDETNEQYHERQPRSHLKHGRMSSTGNGTFQWSLQGFPYIDMTP